MFHIAGMHLNSLSFWIGIIVTLNKYVQYRHCHILFNIVCICVVHIISHIISFQIYSLIDSNETGVNSIQPMCNPWLFNECSGTIPTLVPTLPPDPSDLPSDPNTDGSSDAVVGIVVGTVFGLLILAGVITLVIVGIIVWRRWRKEGTYETSKLGFCDPNYNAKCKTSISYKSFNGVPFRYLKKC